MTLNKVNLTTTTAPTTTNAADKGNFTSLFSNFVKVARLALVWSDLCFFDSRFGFFNVDGHLVFVTSMLLACHKKSYLICVEFSKYYVIFIYFQAAVSALLAVSVLYLEKKSK